LAGVASTPALLKRRDSLFTEFNLQSGASMAIERGRYEKKSKEFVFISVMHYI
jgi:hypothetical protein